MGSPRGSLSALRSPCIPKRPSRGTERKAHSSRGELARWLSYEAAVSPAIDVLRCSAGALCFQRLAPIMGLKWVS